MHFTLKTHTTKKGLPQHPIMMALSNENFKLSESEK